MEAKQESSGEWIVGGKGETERLELELAGMHNQLAERDASPVQQIFRRASAELSAIEAQLFGAAPKPDPELDFDLDSLGPAE